MRGIVLMVVALVLALLPTSAVATVRYASPAGGGAGECPETAPCPLETAVGGAIAGDEVVVAPGTYPLAATLAPTVPLTIHGTPGQPRPQIVASGFSVLESSEKLIVSDLALHAANATQAVLMTGPDSSAERVEVSAGTTALAVGNGFVLRDSLLRAVGPSGAEALFYQATAPSSVTLRNVTAIGSGPGSIALDIHATDTGPGASIEATNVIADASLDASATAAPASSSAIHFFNSNFNTGTGGVSGNAQQVIPPKFVNAAAGDFHEAAGSVTIDAGFTDPGNGALDLDGNLRTANGRTDIGAYEFQPAAVAVAPDTTAAGTLIGAFRLSRKGIVSATLTCPLTEVRCDWSYALRTARRIATTAKRTVKRVLRLGSGKSSARGGKRVTVKMKLSRRNFRLLKRRKRLRVKLTVRTTDAAANRATEKRTAVLSAPKKRGS